jgi:hypothetical protein
VIALGLAALGATLLALAAPTRLCLAQPRGMPNLREISGRPLPDRGMAPGTVSVRVARQALSNPVASTEVVGIVEAAGGDSRKRTARTDGEGRAIFDGLRPGDRFHAEVQVGADLVKSDVFTIPETGGIRTMLVGELPADTGQPPGGAESGGEPAGPPAFTLGMISGTTRLDPSLDRGTIAVTALDEAGRPLANQVLELGQVAADGQVRVTRQTTGADGKATFEKVGLTTPGAEAGATGGAGAGESAAAAAANTTTAAAVVMSAGDVRVGTDGFGIPPTGGIRVELQVPQRTSDPSAISVGEGGRIVFQMRDDAVSFIETFPLQNGSGKIFDPGVGGIEIPLPSEAVNAEGAEGEHKIEIRKGIGVAVHGTIPPRRPVVPNQKSPDEVTFGFVLPVRGSTLSFEQRFPNGFGEFTFVMEQLAGVEIESDQITGRQPRELPPKKYWLMRGAPISPGGTLRFKVTGLPVGDETGKIVASALAVGLALAAILLSRRPATAAGVARQGERERLLERREKLFAELVSVESRRTLQSTSTSTSATAPGAPVQTVAASEATVPVALATTEGAGAAAAPPAGLVTSTLRTELVRKLENVYRELATLDERRAS